MVITKTPFRVSFFGGGTDYPVWFEKHGGAVLSTTIDKYCYITIRHLPPFFEHKHRIIYSIIESVKSIHEIQHPVVRAVLDKFKIDTGVEIHHDADLPARTGLGSSSSFTVGILNSLYALCGKAASPQKLAEEAIHIERDVLKETVGSQDQIAVAYGGLNKIAFNNDHTYKIDPIPLKKERVHLLESHLMLVFSGITRIASKVASEKVSNIPTKEKELIRLQEMVDKAIDIINCDREITEFGELLNESWEIKRSLSKQVSNDHIDSIYANALKSGALGGKILGAGGGGFILLFVPPEKRENVRRSLNGSLEVDFKFESNGSQIIYYHPQ